jgi:type II secretory pathway component GspD/PulD (secretin)
MSRRVLLLAAVGVLSVGGFGLARLGAQTDGASEPAPAQQTVTPEGTTLLEAEPLPPPATASLATNALPDPSPAAPPEPTPPLRTGDVAFPTPAARNESEPLVAIGRPVGRTDYGAEGNRKAAQLRSMPPERFTFDRALLRDVIRFLAESANIPFLSIPENAPQSRQLVTFRMTASPFAALESLARQYRVSVRYEEGVWFLSLSDVISERQKRIERIQESQKENELVAVMYQLRHESPDRVDFRRELMQQRGATVSDSLSTVPGTANLPLQYSQKVFAHRIPRLVNDVRAILGLPPLLADEKTGEVREVGAEETQAGAIVDYDRLAAAARAELEGKEITQLIMTPSGNIERKGDAAIETRPGIGLKQPDTLTPLYVPPEKPQVIYNMDQNSLWVVATRKQHEWVAKYLSGVDKPQNLIAIEVKFLETKKNPQTDIGINWQNTFGTGLTLTGGASIGGTNIGSFNYTNGYNNQTIDSRQIGYGQASNNVITNSFGQSSTFIVPGSPPFNNSVISNVSTAAQIASGSIPYSAVLSLDQFSFTLQAFMQDRDTSVVQYPRVLTLNNREVAITSSENTPLNVGTDDVGSGQGGNTQTVGRLGYLPTGTQINILPKVINSNQISMTVAITVSSIVGELPLNLGTGVNLYPVTSGRVYNASLQVDSGYTLAVGGLEKVDDRNVVGGIPVLKDIPGLGYLFKNKNKARNRVNLIIFITPYLIGDPAKTPGISETPLSVVPLRPGMPPEAPTFTPTGQLSGGEAAVENAFGWLEFQLRYFRQLNLEGMMTLDSIQKLKDVIGVARALLSDMQLASSDMPYDPETKAGRDAIRAEELLADLNRALGYAQDNLM